MALIEQNSQQIPLAEFDLFGVPLTQTTVIEDIVTEHRPISTLDSTHPVEFNITSAKNEYINLRESIISLKLHLEISKTGDVALTDWDKIIPVNNLLYSIFESVDIMIGDTQINTSNSTFSYKTYFDSIFNQGQMAVDTYMQAAGFYIKEDDRKKIFKPKNASSVGKSVVLSGTTKVDLSNQDRAIIGGSTLRFKFIPHKSSFYLIVKDENINVNVIFEEAYMEVHRSKIYDPVVFAHNEALKISNAKYPINRIECKQFTIPKDSNDCFIDNAISGNLPRRIYVGMVDNNAFHGSFSTDPFKFQHFDIDYIVSYYNANQCPSKPYKPNFDASGDCTREYLSLYTVSNQIFGEQKCIITKDQFKNGFTFFGFNYSPDLADDCNKSGHVSLINRGDIRLQLHFKTALPKTINLLLFAEYDSIVQINQERNALTDFS